MICIFLQLVNAFNTLMLQKKLIGKFNSIFLRKRTHGLEISQENRKSKCKKTEGKVSNKCNFTLDIHANNLLKLSLKEYYSVKTNLLFIKTSNVHLHYVDIMYARTENDPLK